MAAIMTRDLDTITGELKQRRARRAVLNERLTNVYAEIAQLRTDAARALANGATNATGGAKAAKLNEEAGATSAAIELLSTDVATLEQEAQGAALAEAEVTEREKIALATVRAEQLDEQLRTFARDILVPAADALTTALQDARAAEARTDTLRRASGTAVPDVSVSRAGRAIHRRGALRALVGQVRAWASEGAR